MGVADSGNTQTVTIANGASESGVVEKVGLRLGGFIMPAAWTAADLTFLVSDDNVTFYPLFNDEKTEAKITLPVAGDAYSFDVLSGILAPWRYFKFRSGVKGAAVNQGAARDIKVRLQA
jgi:hypothetical protein